MSFTRACALDDLTDGKPEPVTVDEVDLALVRNGHEVFAIRDECSHAAIALSEGDVDVVDGVCTIECWLHGSTFDLRTGAPLALPATRPVPVYPVTVDGERVLVDVDVTANV